MATSLVLDTDLRELREYARKRRISSLRELWDDVDAHDERLSRAMDGGAWVAMAYWFGHDACVVDAFAERFCLTSREREVLLHMMGGCMRREVAERLCVSEECVKYHVHNILHKCGCKNMVHVRHALARVARESRPEA